MFQSGFVVAMAADIDLAPYEQPTKILRRTKRWLVVSRLGSEGQHLTLSDSGPLANAPQEAPIGIQPMKTLLGILFANGDSSACTFILAHQRPDQMQLAGTFFPAEGYVHLLGSMNSMRLQAKGRHAHSRGRVEGKEVRSYIGNPAPNSKLAMAWHINATRKPWRGEFIPGASG